MDRYDPFRRQLNQLHSDGSQSASQDFREGRVHLRHRDAETWSAKHECWRKGYDWNWQDQLKRAGVA